MFTERKQKPGKFVDDATKEIPEHGTYQGAHISTSSRISVPLINAGQFYQALADNLSARLFTTSSRSANKDGGLNGASYNNLI